MGEKGVLAFRAAVGCISVQKLKTFFSFPFADTYANYPPEAQLNPLFGKGDLITLAQARAAALQEGKEAEGLANATQGHVEGVEIGGGAEEAVQAAIQ